MQAERHYFMYFLRGNSKKKMKCCINNSEFCGRADFRKEMRVRGRTEDWKVDGKKAEVTREGRFSVNG